MKIQLSIAKDYSPKWGVWEGIRELVQNWMDAFEEGDSIYHNGTCLHIVNQGGAIGPRDIAILGATTKAGDESTRGQFGDGLKVGCLALVREGFEITIRSSGQRYKTSIENSREYGADVLTFRSRKVAKADGVFFMVEGITRSQWDKLRGRFLFDSHGPLLTERPGEIFVKDIWVCTRSGFAFGYNLPKADVGRDRDLINEFNLRYAAGKILAAALESGEASAERLLGLLSEGSEETEYLKNFISQVGKRKIQTAFQEMHGDEAIPIHTERDHRHAEHLGLTPVIVNEALMEAVPALVREKVFENPVIGTIEPKELTEDESENLQTGIDLIGEEAFESINIEIVKFVDDEQMGSRDGGTVNVARWVLEDRWKTLQVLVEELAHSDGIDGSFKHKWAIHKIYTAALQRLSN